MIEKGKQITLSQRNRIEEIKKRKEPTKYNGRTYTDYLEYKVQNPNITTTEMDMVYNNQTGPYIQTLNISDSAKTIRNF